jgi:hypothetical protein
MNNSLSVLRALAYFDLFDYPLTREEIGQFMDRRIAPSELDRALQNLTDSTVVLKYNNYFCLKSPEALVKRREAGNELASHLIPKAMRISRFLYQFPFVRGVGISGSLSKNFADEQADIDYFIITKSNRLWMARTIMHLFKKLTFLVGKQHCFCMNYYVDEDALGIQEKNVFTAIEVAKLIPVCGNGSMENFFTANAWIENYCPNYIIDVESRKNSKHSIFKRSCEFMLDLLPTDQLDNTFMKLTSRRWKRKEDLHRLNMAGRRMGLDTSKHYSKPNPQHFQRQILEMFEMKWTETMRKFEAANVVV